MTCWEDNKHQLQSNPLNLPKSAQNVHQTLMIMIDLYFFLERNVAFSIKLNLEIKLCCLIVLKFLCLLKICCNQGIFSNYFLKIKSVLFTDYLSLSKQKKERQFEI